MRSLMFLLDLLDVLAWLHRHPAVKRVVHRVRRAWRNHPNRRAGAAHPTRPRPWGRPNHRAASLVKAGLLSIPIIAVILGAVLLILLAPLVGVLLIPVTTWAAIVAGLYVAITRRSS